MIRSLKPIKFILSKSFTLTGTGGKITRKYLLREHNLLQRLNHPHIVAYLGYGENVDQTKATLYLEFCNGGDLVQYSARPNGSDDSSDDGLASVEPSAARPLDEMETWSIVFQLAAALAYCHHGLSMKEDGSFYFEKNWDPVIHRDIKPSNG